MSASAATKKKRKDKLKKIFFEIKTIAFGYRTNVNIYWCFT